MTIQTSEERLGREKISRLLISFSIPAIAAVLTQGIYNLVARLFVGRAVDSLALAGIQVAFPLMLIQFGLFALICGGATALISIRLGEQRKDAADRIFGNGLVMVILIGLVMPLTALPNLYQILAIFATSENVAPYAAEYLGLILLGSPIMAVSTYFTFVTRGEGNPQRSMQISLISALSNILMTFLFIMVFKMGVMGAALSTILASSLGTLWGLHYFFLSKRKVLTLKLKNLLLSPVIIRSILALGFSSCIGTFATGIQSGILIRQVQLHGSDMGAAAMGIMFGIISIAIMPLFGLADAIQPIVGYNYGAGKLQRVRQTLQQGLTVGFIFGLCASMILWILARPLTAVFVPEEPQLQTLAAHGLRMASWALALASIQILVPRYLQAIGKALEATLLGLSRQILFFIPLIFILPYFLGLNGAWLTIACADFGAGIVCGLRVMLVLRKRIRREPIQPAEATLPPPPEQNHY